MGSTGRNCIRWWEHPDRDCKSDEKMRFHVVADENFRNFMRIPQEFGSQLRKIISDTIKLNAPNGCTYDIGVSREMGEIVLRSGWDVFANAHNLEQNDYLVFKFCGSSSFKVHIYSSCDGSQKITSCINSANEILHDTSDHHTPNGGSRLTKAQDKKVLEVARTIKPEIPLYVAVTNKSNVDLNGCSIRIPSILMKDVRDEVFKATVKLEAPDNNVYSVSATQQSTDEIVLQSGWDAFVVAHHVQERDLIIFRHKGNSRLEVFILDPSGYQKTSSWFGTGDVSNTQEMCDDSVEIVDAPHETVDIIDLSSSSDDENNVAEYSAKSARFKKQQLVHCVKTRRMASTSCPSIESDNETHEDLHGSMVGRVDLCRFHSNNSEGASWPPYFMSHKAKLSEAQEKMVLEKVRAIRSRFPIYVAVMNRTSIDQKALVTFNMEYSRRCLPSATQDLTLQLEGCQSKEWHTVLHVQGGHSSARDMRKISGGWAEFVCDNHLRLGDICLFELVKVTRKLRMNVHLIRKA